MVRQAHHERKAGLCKKSNESKGEIEFDKQQKIKIQEFKKIWKLEEKSTQKSFSFIPWIAAIIIILAISKVLHKHSANAISRPTEQSSTILKPTNAFPLPKTSVLTTEYNLESATCPLTFIADNQNYYVKLCDSRTNGTTVAKFFIRAGETLKTKVPSGQYIKPPTKYLNYAIISAWKKEMQEH
jgi:hypothetical protein